MGQFGYDFYFTIGEEVLTLPITPNSLKMSVGSKNKVVTLINEGDVNILKSPSLPEFEFDARFPMRDYPYSRKALFFETYLNKFTALKTEKTPFIFDVYRSTPDGKGTWRTSRRVTLEDLEVEENADEGDDVIVSFKLKEYKEYGVRTIQSADSTPTTTSTSEQPRSNDGKANKSGTYTVRSGDTLWAIAKAKYNDGSKWTAIYEANKSVIESTAEKNRGKGKGSSNGQWIYPNTVLVIPDIETANKKQQESIQYKKLTLMESKLDKKYTITIKNTGSTAYWGSSQVSVNGVVKKGGQATDYTIEVQRGAKVKITAQGVNGHSYTISNPEFTVGGSTTVTIHWVR